MEKVYKYLLNQLNEGTIKQETAVEAIKLIKEASYELGGKRESDIAIIGMALKLPNADTVEAYWENVANGIDCISHFPETRKINVLPYLQQIRDITETIKFCESAYLDQIDSFDYNFFNLSPKEASLIDPTQRMFLEVAWGAIEDAGYAGERIKGSQTGVYVGFASNLRDMYAKMINDVCPELISSSIIGNLTAMIPSRISYLLDLKGPSMVIDTACSSSLVALDTACKSLIFENCEMALVGGINVNLLPIKSVDLKMGIESFDGRTRAFNESSDGAGIGEGIAAILLKPLCNAIKDRDQIYGVIKGTAINQDGASIGITAPNPAAQTSVIELAWKNAKIDPETITYIEAHGTGTNLGDPIEITGISKAFEKYTRKKQFCSVSSVKTNIGHLSEAAGIVSLIKAVMALKHKALPPQIYFFEPNQTISFTKSPIYVNTKLRAWEPENGTRRCGVSAFGISGTNAHVILEEYNASNVQESSKLPQILSISAKTQIALSELLIAYYNHVDKMPETDLESLCYTVNTGRNHFNWRCAIVFTSKGELQTRLTALINNQEMVSGVYRGHYTIIVDDRKKVDDGISERLQEHLTQEVSELIGMMQFTKSAEFFLNQICQKYVLGANVAWELIYSDRKLFKVSAPTYSFEKNSCWLTLDSPVTYKKEKEEGFYTFQWIERPANNERVLETGTVLYIKGSKPINNFEKKLIEGLKKRCNKWIVAELGQKFEEVGLNHYIIGSKEEDYLSLMEAVQGQKLAHIIHGGTLGYTQAETFEMLQDAMNAGLYSLFYLIKAIVQKGMECNLAITLVSAYVNAIGQEEMVYPCRAAFFGLGKTIIHEHNGIDLKCIDIDWETSVDKCIMEIFERDSFFQIALRQDKRYVEKFTEIEMEDVEDRNLNIRDNGVYLITGGTGGIGLEVSKHFARLKKVNLVWVGRRSLPDKNQSNLDSKSLRTLKVIEEIEQMGSTVTYLKGDCSDEQRMLEVFDVIEKQFGTLSGIVHSAGRPGDGFLAVKSKEVFDSVIQPKVHGTWILGQLCKKFNIDFFMLFSSGLSMLSEPGHGDYTAANSYVDSFAWHLRKQGIEGFAINWTSWRETGMAVDHGFNYDAIFKAISTREALTGLDTVMQKQVARSLVGYLTYNPQFLYLINRLPFELSDKIRRKSEQIIKEKGIDLNATKVVNKKSSSKVSLKGKDGNEFTQVEMELAKIYNSVLGFEEINIYDNFFELGGDSVMLNQMLALLDQTFPKKVKLIDLFNYTNIVDLAMYISSGEEVAATINNDEDLDEIESLLDALDKGELNIDEIIENVSV